MQTRTWRRSLTAAGQVLTLLALPPLVLSIYAPKAWDALATPQPAITAAAGPVLPVAALPQQAAKDVLGSWKETADYTPEQVTAAIEQAEDVFTSQITSYQSLLNSTTNTSVQAALTQLIASDQAALTSMEAYVNNVTQRRALSPVDVAHVISIGNHQALNTVRADLKGVDATSPQGQILNAVATQLYAENSIFDPTYRQFTVYLKDGQMSQNALLTAVSALDRLIAISNVDLTAALLKAFSSPSGGSGSP